MHELSLALSVVDYLERLGREQEIKKIEAVYFEIGGMTHVDPAQFRFSFKLASEGTIAEGSRVYIKKVNPILKCKSCGKEVKIEVGNIGTFLFKCPSCGGRLEIQKGRELTLKRVKGTK
ncbi:MAG: hydrogenase maturation nickel metallochaperone HypA [Candidatus Methanomethylicaceae archaeon]